MKAYSEEAWVAALLGCVESADETALAVNLRRALADARRAALEDAVKYLEQYAAEDHQRNNTESSRRRANHLRLAATLVRALADPEKGGTGRGH